MSYTEKYQQKKSKKFADALEEFEAFKIEFHFMNPDATEEEYQKALEDKAQELDL